ncbi:type II CRISPR-associated endonuclease Cas1 [Roseivirga pacifica]
MYKRSIYFTKPCYLHIKHKQLIVELRNEGLQKMIPLEDVGFIVLENPQITITTGAIEEMANQNIAVIFCDKKYMPTSMLFHLDTHYVQQERFHSQVNASVPLKKQLWQQTVKSKILNQARVLKKFDADNQSLLQMAKDVQSGDTGGKEAQAAKVYWKRLFGSNFNRERFGDWPNPMLNYGYAIIRAATARALAASGLLNTLGIHHRNKYNSFCLADDIMEPFRPWVDAEVNRIYSFDENPELTKEHKAALLSVLSHDAIFEESKSPLMVAIQKSAQTLALCFEGKKKKLNYPILE